ncbi:uncharacterized protein LOC115620229 [Scaptodrosophila lebanonensis]|uniref:Uncharacterized protein LOC115620229 n=1 Tax=Drosophila lebanonensis TaxID=7225 RepID=A0A6J2T1U6_DROLE|nr:uncharacterized protein LOC115620229 [Scaptodrosophila lebanonensis]
MPARFLQRSSLKGTIAITCFVFLRFIFLLSALLFPTNTCFGLFMAISVPAYLPNRNVFVSYNFEFNYYLPEHVYKYPPYLADDPMGIGSYLTYNTTSPENDCYNCRSSARQANNYTDNSIEPEPEPAPSLFTRSSLYSVLRDTLDRIGYPSEACLLRLICETNAATLGDSNGFLGSLLHIILTPSTSQDDQLPDEYYEAEESGQHNSCDSYKRNCAESVLDIISMPMEKIIGELVSK